MSKHAAPPTAPTPPESTPSDSTLPESGPTTELAMTTYDPSADLAGTMDAVNPTEPSESVGSGDPGARTESLESAVPAPVPSAAAREVVCPECGTVARVAINRRESHDFCAECDFPLFWTPSQVVLGDAGAAGAALRRLPGTAGRAAIGALTCPHCTEANPISGETCLRCGGELHLAPPAPPPAPPPVAAPLPPTPLESPRPVWPIVVVVTLTLLLLVTVVVVLIRR